MTHPEIAAYFEEIVWIAENLKKVDTLFEMFPLSEKLTDDYQTFRAWALDEVEASRKAETFAEALECLEEARGCIYRCREVLDLAE